MPVSGSKYKMTQIECIMVYRILKKVVEEAIEYTWREVRTSDEKMPGGL